MRFAEKADDQGRWSGWKVLDYRSKTAYGCEGYGSSVLNDLLLLARVVDPPGPSSLCIQAASSICAVAADPNPHPGARVVLRQGGRRRGEPRRHLGSRFHEFTCYLIYNSDDSSLAMIPDPFPTKPSWGCWAFKAAPPLPVQRQREGSPLGACRLPLPQGVEHLAGLRLLKNWGSGGDSRAIPSGSVPCCNTGGAGTGAIKLKLSTASRLQEGRV
ncbi:hypothetical protein U9M48_041605 [Paspalum notatum var. saurae]|uniref:Uncharacterized protein n=1 Tax=Paspalum notatum var. saurae TaxID=547442 RepID=A0AAQ3UNQ2_PASNO